MATHTLCLTHRFNGKAFGMMSKRRRRGRSSDTSGMKHQKRSVDAFHNRTALLQFLELPYMNRGNVGPAYMDWGKLALKLLESNKCREADCSIMGVVYTDLLHSKQQLPPRPFGCHALTAPCSSVSHNNDLLSQSFARVLVISHLIL